MRVGTVMLFREGIKPMWEDPANRAGGKLSLKQLRKGHSTQIWEALVLAMIGENLRDAADVCGAVVNLRYDDSFALWHKCADGDAVARLRCVVARPRPSPLARSLARRWRAAQPRRPCLPPSLSPPIPSLSRAQRLACGGAAHPRLAAERVGARQPRPAAHRVDTPPQGGRRRRRCRRRGGTGDAQRQRRLGRSR